MNKHKDFQMLTYVSVVLLLYSIFAISIMK